MSSVGFLSKFHLLKASRLFISQQNLYLHSNRSQICRIKRGANEYCRQYPVKIVFKDGSAITTRHEVPREIIKLPLTFEQCENEVQRKQWLGRRKLKEVIEIRKDDTDVSFNQMQYLKNMKLAQKKKSGR